MRWRVWVGIGVAPAVACLFLGAAAVRALPMVKISLSPEDPNVHVTEHTGTEPVTFYVFVDGMALRAAEFGLEIRGGEFVEFNIDTEKFWVPLPEPDLYPGTIAQAGSDCYKPPVYFGKLIVRPTEPGESIVVDAAPSERDQQTVFQKCDFGVINKFVAYAAAVNDRPPSPHEVEGPRPYVGKKLLAPKAGPEPPPRPARARPEAEAPTTDEDVTDEEVEN